MKIKKDKIKDLQNIGFKKVVLRKNDPMHLITNMSSDIEIQEIMEKYEDFKKNYVAEDYEDPLFYYEHCYVYDIGSSRRGQWYYLIVKNREILVLATKPDGSGGAIALGNIISELIKGGFI